MTTPAHSTSKVVTGFVTCGEIIFELVHGHVAPLELILIPLCTYLLSELIIETIRLHPIKAYTDEILRIEHISEQLETFVKHSIIERVRAMQSLVTSRAAPFTYADQIAIAESLIHNATLNDIDRVWATTTDRPSKLWRKIHYFKTQEELKNSVGGSFPTTSLKRKVRVVIGEWSELRADMTSADTAQDFLNFVKWHEENDFDLRFHIATPSQVRIEIGSTVSDTPVMPDFMIIEPNPCVYGRTEEGGGSEVQVRFIPRDPTADEQFDTFTLYGRAFMDLHHKSETYEQVRQRLELERQQAPVQQQLFTDYGRIFQTDLVGAAFFRKVCEQLSSPRGAVGAVDIADIKEGAQCWAYKEEYLAFLEATIQAARAGNQVCRIFVLGSMDLIQNSVFQQVLRQQITAGIEVRLIRATSVSEQKLTADDFIFVKDTFGFRLGTARFDKSELGFAINLIAIGLLKNQFQPIFDKLKTNAEHTLTTIAELEQLIAGKEGGAISVAAGA